jgi:hypothetical protein
VVVGESGPRLRAWDRKRYEAGEALPAREATVSLKGTLAAPDRFRVSELHEHAGMSRDYGSVAGLAVLALGLGVGMLRRRTPAASSSSEAP